MSVEEDERLGAPAGLAPAILGAISDGITVQDDDGRLVYANDAAARLVGFDSAAELLAAALDEVVGRFEVLDEHRRRLPFEQLPGRIALTERRETTRTVCYRIRSSGEERWSAIRSLPIVAEDGRLVAVNLIRDVIDSRRTSEQLRLLSDASELLVSSLDTEITIEAITNMLVPGFADYCLIDLVQPDGGLEQAALRHNDPERELVLRQIRDRYPPTSNSDHPASLVLSSGTPLLIATTDDPGLERAALDAEHLELYRQLDPSSYLVVPLLARGRTIGTLSLGMGESRRHYDDADVVFAQEVAGRMALGVDNARLYGEASESLALLDTLLVSSPVAIGYWDPELRFVRVNDALAAINGVPAVEHAGRTIAEIIPGLAPTLEPLYRRVLATGEPVVHEESTDEEIAGPGSARHWLSSYYPVRTEGGETIGVGGVIMEITAQHRADARVRLLAEAGALFASSLEVDAILEQIQRVVLPRLGDSIHIFLAEEGVLRRATCAHVDPERQSDVESMPDAYELGPESPTFMATVFDRGEPVLFSEVERDFYEHLVRLGADRGALERVGSRSMMLVPLVARGAPLGVMAIGARRPGRYTETDLTLATELAGRAAAAIDNARLVRELTFRSTVLEAQQEASLDGLLLVSPEGAMISYNRRFAEVWDFSDDLIAAGSDDAALAEAMTKVADPAEFIARVQYLYDHPESTSREEVKLKDGRILDRYGSPVRGPDGGYFGWLWSFRDVTEQKRAQSAVDFLAEASTLFASSLDYEATLASLAHLAVPRLADWCSVTMLDPEGGLRTLAAVHADPAKTRWAEELARRFPPDPEATNGVAQVIRTGEPELTREISEELLQLATANREGYFEILRELGLRSALVVPLRARGSTLGALALVSAESGRLYDESDLELAQEVARRAAIAVDNALLYLSLEQSDRRRQYALDSALLGSWELDLSTLEADRSLLHDLIFGYGGPAPEWSYQRFLEHVHPVDREEVDKRFQAAIAERGDWDFECRITRADGIETWIWVRGAVEVDPSGRPLSMVGLVRDVGDLKEAEAELQRRAQAAQALEFIGEGVFLLDGDEVVRLWNPAAEAITGLREAAVVGRRLAEAIPAWAAVAAVAPVADGRQAALVRPETVPVDVNGRELWISISGVAFGAGTVYAFRDLTEERAVERLKSDFVSTVSHELRTPLAAIYGAAMTLKRGDVVLSEEQRDGMLGVVAGESERLARIVNDILLASRLDSGATDVSIGRADAAELVRMVAAAASARLPERIDLTVALPDDGPPIFADTDKVRQVLVNLVENAIKYSPDGGEIKIELEPVEGRMRFSVSDRGLGIPASEQGRIFEKFYRLDPNLTRGVGGTGLGLYICREIVRRMDGRIWVESEPGVGSTFSFDLPLA